MSAKFIRQLLILRKITMETTINQRVRTLVDTFCDGNVSEFARVIGVSQPTIRDVVGTKQVKPGFDALKKMVENSSLSINSDWLMTGKGRMKKDGKFEAVVLTPLEEKKKELRVIPSFRIVENTSLSEVFLHEEKYLDGLIAIPNMPSVDGAITVRGNNMEPLIKAGDLVVYKKLSDTKYIIPGQTYILEYTWDNDVRTVISYVHTSQEKDSVKLLSMKTMESPHDILISTIKAIALIKIIIRYNSI